MTHHDCKETEGVPFNDRMKEIAWSNIHNCDDCGGSSAWCGTDKRKMVFGREFKVCVSPIAFTGPDAEAVECMKKMVDMKKHAIDASVTTPVV